MTAPANEPVNLRSLQILSTGLLTCIILFSVLAFALNEFSFKGDHLLELPFQVTVWVAGGINVIIIALAHYMYKRKTEALRNFSSAGQDKLSEYRNLLIRYMALVEASGLFSTFVFYITGNYWLLAFVVLVIAAMIYKFPTRQKVIADAGLDWQEQDLLK